MSLNFLFSSNIIGLAGFRDDAASNEARANRCVNLYGGDGRNIPVDHAMEMVNRDFHSMCSKC